MANNVKTFIAAGFNRCYYVLLDANGYASGPTGTVVAGATGAGSGRMLGVKTSDINIVEPGEESVTGDNGVLGKFLFAPNETPGFTIEVGASDLNIDARIQDTLVQDVGNISFGVLQPTLPVYKDVGLLFIRDAKSQDSGSVGVSGYEGIILPKANLVSLGNTPFTERAAGSQRYRVVTNLSDALPMGVTLTYAANGTESAPITRWTSPYLMAWHRWTQTGSATVFNIEKTPASTSLNDVLVYVNGVRMPAGVTISDTGKTLTFGTAPADNAKIVAFYAFTE